MTKSVKSMAKIAEKRVLILRRFLHGAGKEKDDPMRLVLDKMLKVVTAGFGALALLGGVASGQTLESRLDQVLEEVSGDVPGAILSVSTPDFNYANAVGLSNRRTDAPMRTDHTLRLGSITKTYIAVLALMAEDDGRLDLDRSIEAYLGAEVMSTLPDGLNPTVRQLLNHTSGVPDYYGVRFYFQDWRDRGPLTTELVLHAIRGKSATNAPGEAFSYSNTNYHLIALILEEVFEDDLDSLLQARIFEPLGLERTYYSQMFAPGDDVHGYGGLILPWVDTYEWEENTGPDGGMFASVRDLAIWTRALFSPDGVFFDYGERMMANPVRDNARVEQGLGVEIITASSGARVEGHTGGLDGYSVGAFYMREADAVIIFFINSSSDAFSEGLIGALRAVREG